MRQTETNSAAILNKNFFIYFPPHIKFNYIIAKSRELSIKIPCFSE